MNNLAHEFAFDAQACLAWEARQSEKHEFIAGEVFAMVGAKGEHAVVSLNLAAAFKQSLRGGPEAAGGKGGSVFLSMTLWCRAMRTDRTVTHFIKNPATDRGSALGFYGRFRLGHQFQRLPHATLLARSMYRGASKRSAWRPSGARRTTTGRFTNICPAGENASSTRWEFQPHSGKFSRMRNIRHLRREIIRHDSACLHQSGRTEIRVKIC
ncbi:MAG TPA: hypothetical protein VI457_15020 [Methylococcaceae bacterium]|nr:hypothetical protein [Methylococcaceae bacterium]